MGERKVIALFSSRLNVPNKKIPDISSGHRKIGTSKNNLFADRFRAENKDFLAELEADRAEMLSYHI